MAIIRDTMPAFELYQPASSEAAVALLDKQGKDAWIMAGGLDSLDWFKDRAKRPKAVVDLSQLQDLREIRDLDGGVEIGAMATLTQVAAHPRIQGRLRPYWRKRRGAWRRRRFAIRAPWAATSGRTRAVGITRSGMNCYRAGGNTCYADTPTAMNREHCLFEADRCVAVSPSDTAPALIALEAQMVIQNAKGERRRRGRGFFYWP